MPESHSAESVAVGIARFLDEFRSSFGTDAESELAEPPMCAACRVMPAAYLGQCFGCHAKTGLTS